MCLHAHVGVHVPHICTCVLERLRVSPALTHRAGVKSSSDKLIISSLEERWLTEREAANQHLMVEQKPRNYSQPSGDRGGLRLNKATWISSSAWCSEHVFSPTFHVHIRPIYKNNCDWKKSSRHVAFIDQSGRGILMHMNKFHFPEIVDIRSRLSCFALLCLVQNRLFWCIVHCWVHQYTHTDSFKSESELLLRDWNNDLKLIM